VVVPAATPVTIPDALTVANSGLRLTQLAPNQVPDADKGVVAPTHTLVAPEVVADGAECTVIV
jgi:hypothetical protein